MKTLARSWPSSRIEILETRVAPAGVILVDYSPATGTLTIAGDVGPDDIVFYATGPSTHRLESRGDPLSTGGAFLDLGKVSMLIFHGDGGADRLELHDLSLKSLTFDGGASGGDVLQAWNLKTTGNVDLLLAGGGDQVEFDGLMTKIGGNLNVTADGGAEVNLDAWKTTIGGSIVGTNSGALLTLRAEEAGSLAIQRGISMSTPTGAVSLEFEPLGPVFIGKLSTGESIKVASGAGNDSIRFNSGNVTLAGGVELTGTGGNKSIASFALRSNLSIGKLPTGHSIDLEGPVKGSILLQNLNLNLAGGIEMVANGVENSISLRAPAGKVAVGKLASGHSIRLEGGNGDDSINIDAYAATLAGGIELLGQQGYSHIGLQGVSGSTRIGKLPSGASLRLTGGTIAAIIDSNVGSLVLTGGIEMSGVNGPGTIAIGTPSNSRSIIGKLKTGESIRFEGGTLQDYLSLDGASATLAGGIFFNGGDGNSALNLGSETTVLKIGKLQNGASIHYSTGDSLDGILARAPQLTLAGGIIFNGGNGQNSVIFQNPTSVTIGATNTGASLIFSGGSGNDTVTVTGEHFKTKGSMDFNAGDGTNSVDFFEINAALGKDADGTSFRYVGGTGTDRVDANDSLRMAGAFSFTGGENNNRVLMSEMDQLSIKGAVNYQGGAGSDEFSIYDSSIQLARSVTFEGGGGSDEFRLRANGTIGGNLSIGMGASGIGMRYVDIKSLGGRLRGLTLGGDLAMSASGVASDYWYIENVTIKGNLNAALGEGTSQLSADNFTIGKSLMVDTGEGGDFVGLEQATNPGGSIVTKLASILMQGGNDTLLIGSALTGANPPFPDPSRVRFLAGLTVDGGTGTDNRNALETENDFPGGAPVGLGTFE